MRHFFVLKNFYLSVFLCGVLFSGSFAQSSPNTKDGFSMGLSIGNTQFWSFNTAFKHKHLFLNGGIGGFWYKKDQWWASGDFAVGMVVFQKARTVINLSLGLSYAWYQAPDAIAQSINELFGQRVLYGYQYMETVNFGPVLGLRIRNLHFQYMWVVHGLRDKNNRIEYKLGYLWNLPFF